MYSKRHHFFDRPDPHDLDPKVPSTQDFDPRDLRTHDLDPRDHPERPVSETDRHIASRANSFTSSLQYNDLLSGKLEGIFDSTPTSYKNNLTMTLWSKSHSDLENASHRNLAVVREKPRKPVRKPHDIHWSLTLDAPNLINDYYGQLLCRNELYFYVALGPDVYSYHVESKCVAKISADESNCSAIGCSESTLVCSVNDSVVLYDTRTNQTCASIANNAGNYISIRASGPYCYYMLNKSDRQIAHYDIRCSDFASITEFNTGHLIGLSVNPLGGQTIAVSHSDENGDRVKLFNTTNLTESFAELEQGACSKALAFSPYLANQILTAGGSEDFSIKLWDINTSKVIAKGQNDGQITSLSWIDRQTVLLTEGYSLNNRICTWGIIDDKIRLETAIGSSDNSYAHSQRILTAVQKPSDPTKVITLSADETIRFWSVQKPVANPPANKKPRSALHALTIR